MATIIATIQVLIFGFIAFFPVLLMFFLGRKSKGPVGFLVGSVSGPVLMVWWMFLMWAFGWTEHESIYHNHYDDN